MADGLIIRRGGSAGTAVNVITEGHKLLLPTTAKKDTIGVIGSTPNTVYVQQAPPDGSERDIWITPEDSVYDINLAKKGSLLIDIGNVYQYIQGEWIEKDAYIFRDGEWLHVWNKVFYDNGKMTGKVAHLDSLTPSGCKVTYDESHIQCVTKSGSASEVYAVFGPVDLTEMNTLATNGTYPKAQNGTTYAVLGVANSEYASFTDEDTADEYIVKDTVKDNKAGKAFALQLDVSGLTGYYYVFIGTNTAGGAWANTRYVNFMTLKGV